MLKAKVRVLAIESSCDESAAAVLDESEGLLAHELWSQIELHRAYGGVVPELASRDHVRKLLPLIERVLAGSGTDPRTLAAVAFTGGPGLIGALLTGAALARSLAYAWQVPALAVHHLEGHLLAPLLEPDPPPRALCSEPASSASCNGSARVGRAGPCRRISTSRCGPTSPP